MSKYTGKVVLIVDDSSSIRMKVKAILQREGFVVREAGTEYGMLGSLNENGVPVDIILMDLSLNDANGFDLVKEVHSMEKFSEVPVIMLTQYSGLNNVSTAKFLGIRDYIVKPFDSQVLVDRIKKLLD